MSKNTIALLGAAEGEQDVFAVYERTKAAKKNKKDAQAERIYSTGHTQEVYDLISAASAIQGIPSVNDIIVGRVVAVRDAEVLVEAGLKDNISVSTRAEEAQFTASLAVGDEVTVIVTGVEEGEDFRVSGSLAKMQARALRQELDVLYSTNGFVSAVVTGMNPGGYTLNLGLEAGTASLFMPHMMAGVNKLSNAGALVGTTTNVMLDSYSDERGTYIASRKKYLETLIPAERDKLEVVDFEAIRRGEEPAQYLGVVTGATSFGVFVEFNGCLTGMIHRANILPEYAEMIADIDPGTEIAFYVKEIAKGGRIILTQVVRESLWDTIRHKQVLTGTVRDIKHFGVLVKLDDETTGLVHTSEVAKAGKKTEDFKRGDSISVRVLMVNKGEHKIFLALNR
jgi:ribosomal protein S1